MPSPGRDVGEGEPGWDSRRAGGQEPGAHPSYRRGPASSAELLLSWLASWRLCAMLGRDFLAPCSAGRAHLPPPPPPALGLLLAVALQVQEFAREGRGQLRS